MTEKSANTFKKHILPGILALLVYFPLFMNLDRLPMMLFDESRVAMSSYEMSKDYNLLVVHYDGKPDMWSTKPPMANWAQVFFIKTLGFNVLSVRLPSAIAGFLCCVILWLLATRYLKNHWVAFVSIMALITSSGFVCRHVTRTADYDAMLVLFTLASSVFYFLFIESGNYKYLRWFFIALAMAVLTKTVAGLLLLPGLFMYTLFNYKSLVFFKNPKTYKALLFFVIPVVVVILGRELLNPGYLQALWKWEIGGRFGSQMAGDAWYPEYYIKRMANEHYRYWYLITIGGAVLGLLMKDRRIRCLTLFATCASVGFLTIVSMAKTQMLWYEAPVYPFVALLAGIGVYWAADVLQKLVNNLVVNILPFVLVIVLCFEPYTNMFKSVFPPHFPHEWEIEEQALNFYLIDAYKTGKKVDGYHWVDKDTYNPYIDFHAKMLEDNKGQKVTRKNLEDLTAGETVIGFQTEIKPKIEAAYTFDVLEEKGFVKVYKITGKRQTPDTATLSPIQSQ